MNSSRRYPPYVRRNGNLFFFRFIIAKPQLTVAQCHGFTEHDFTPSKFGGAQQENINTEHASGSLRFPFADKFTTPEECSAECDRWLAILSRRYSVPIRIWSKPEQPIDFQKPDGLELREFLQTNERALLTWKSSQNDEDRIARYLAKSGNEAQRLWAAALLAEKDRLTGLESNYDFDLLVKKMTSVRGYAKLATSPLDKLAMFHELRDKIAELRKVQAELFSSADTLIRLHEDSKGKLEALKASRPE